MKKITVKTLKGIEKIMDSFFGVDFKATAEVTLAEVDNALWGLGYEVIIADVGDDHVWFDIQKSAKRKHKHLKES